MTPTFCKTYFLYYLITPPFNLYTWQSIMKKLYVPPPPPFFLDLGLRRDVSSAADRHTDFEYWARSYFSEHRPKGAVCVQWADTTRDLCWVKVWVDTASDLCWVKVWADTTNDLCWVKVWADTASDLCWVYVGDS